MDNPLDRLDRATRKNIARKVASEMMEAEMQKLFANMREQGMSEEDIQATFRLWVEAQGQDGNKHIL
jgi:DNA-binding transcriptional regulator YhcF (GntR family)